MRELAAGPGGDVQREDLNRVVGSGSRSEIREDDGPTVGAEGELRPPARAEATPGGGGRIRHKPEGRIATGGTETTQSRAIAADDEYPFLLARRDELIRSNDREVVRHLEDDLPTVPAHPQAVERAHDR